MRRMSMLLAVVMAFLLLGEGLASAAPRRARSKRARVVRPAPVRHPVRRPRTHYVYRGGVWVAVPVTYPVYTETVVVAPPPPPPEPVYVEEPAPRPRRVAKRDDRDVGLLLKLGGLGYGPTRAETEDLALGSFGGAVRLGFDPHWALELSAELARGSDQQMRLSRTVTPLTASLVLNLLPTSALNIYGLAGVGVQFAEVRAKDFGYRTSYSRPEGHLGAGVELRLSPALRLFSELRFIGLGTALSEDVSDPAKTPPSWLSLDEGDQAVQFNAGLGVYF